MIKMCVARGAVERRLNSKSRDFRHWKI